MTDGCATGDDGVACVVDYVRWLMAVWVVELTVGSDWWQTTVNMRKGEINECWVADDDMAN